MIDLTRRWPSPRRLERDIPFVPGRLLALALVLSMPGALQAQEFFIHSNGDSINAEIKSFSRGKLSYEIPGSSSASLEFQNVATIGSPEDWDIELTGQRKLFGSILPGPEDGTVRIATPGDTVTVAISEITQMTNVSKTLWSRFDGFVEFGFNYAKANNATNLNFATRIDYRAPKWLFGASLDSRFQDQDDAESFRRNQATLFANYLLPKTWYVGAFTQLEQNQQLDLDLRLLLGALGGRDILQSNKVEWNWLAGVLSNREEYEGLEANTSAEAVLGTRFSWFTFGDWQNDLSSGLLVYPSLTESGRVRTDFDVSYRQDLFGDLYFRLSFYHQYDSEPPPGASDIDFGTSLALGWDI
jgi:putative salt-induced outer membrane protein YdiY